MLPLSPFNMTATSSSASDPNSFAAQFEKLFGGDGGNETFRPGKVVTGTVVGINREVVTVDIGFKSEGVVPTDQFPSVEGVIQAKIGDQVSVFIVALENEMGQVLLSKEKADQKRVWDQVETAYKNNSVIQGKVVQKVKGGLQVDIGIPAFLPGSQIDIRPHRNLDKFLEQTFDFKVLKITRDKGNIVLSRRAVLMSERDQLRTETLKVLQEGVVMEGVVKNVTDYGAFIDLGGIDGLLHITDISWGRVNHPSEKLSVGQTVPVVVLKYDGEKERVSLGMKQLKTDPWGTVHERFPTNARVKGKVTNLTEYGAFVELEEGVEGLIHISEMSWTKKVKNPSKLLNQGDMVEAVVLGIDTEQQRIRLGLKQLMPNPWDELLSRLPRGTKVKGKVRSITDFGIFVGIDEGIDGLVHVSDFSWTKRISDPKEIQDLFKKGDDVEAVVLDVDPGEQRLSLGIKQLSEDPFETLSQRFPVGSHVKGAISSVTDFGVFVPLEEGIEGLIHKSELGLKKGEELQKVYEQGKQIDAEVINIDRDSRKISLRPVREGGTSSRESGNLAQYMEDSFTFSPTIGGLISEKMGKKE